MLKSILLAFSTLTVLPIPYSWYENGNGKKAASFFPLVGLVVGLFLAACAMLFLKCFSVECSALVVLFLSLWVSRAFHLDGFADCADAFWSSRPKEKKLEIMKDSRIGVMGVVALMFLLGAKFIFIREIMVLENVFLYVFLFPFCGRCSMNFHMYFSQVKDDGLGAFFWDKNSFYPSLILLVIVFFSFMSWQKGAVVCIALLLSSIAWSWYVKKNIEKASGDTLGASCEWGELLLLFLVTEVFPYIS